MSLNVPLLRKTMEHIEAHPDEWHQDWWARQDQICGTTMCFAGTVVLLAGAELIWDDKFRPHCLYATECKLPDGSRDLIESFATRELGLHWSDADQLFHNYTSDPAELRKCVEEICVRYGEAL